MNFNDPSEFGKAYQALCVNDPQKIHAAFEDDQLADDDAALDLEPARVYLHPDGEHFEVGGLCGDGGCFTTTGRVIPKDEFAMCRKLPISRGFRR